MLEKGGYIAVLVTVREEAVTCIEKEKPKAGVNFLSYCVYHFETSF